MFYPSFLTRVISSAVGYCNVRSSVREVSEVGELGVVLVVWDCATLSVGVSKLRKIIRIHYWERQ